MVVQWLALSPHSKKVLSSDPLRVIVKRHAICGKCELTALKMSEGVNVRVNGCYTLPRAQDVSTQMQLG